MLAILRCRAGGRESLPLMMDGSVDWNRVTRRLCYMDSALELTRANAWKFVHRMLVHVYYTVVYMSIGWLGLILTNNARECFFDQLFSNFLVGGWFKKSPDLLTASICGRWGLCLTTRVWNSPQESSPRKLSSDPFCDEDLKTARTSYFRVIGKLHGSAGLGIPHRIYRISSWQAMDIVSYAVPSMQEPFLQALFLRLSVAYHVIAMKETETKTTDICQLNDGSPVICGKVLPQSFDNFVVYHSLCNGAIPLIPTTSPIPLAIVCLQIMHRKKISIMNCYLPTNQGTFQTYSINIMRRSDATLPTTWTNTWAKID